MAALIKGVVGVRGEYEEGEEEGVEGEGRSYERRVWKPKVVE